MILIDVNLLIYASNADAVEHDASRRWLERVLSGREPVRFAWLTLWAFLRIVTSRRVFSEPLSIHEAEAHVSAWLARPNAAMLEPGERHHEILASLLRDGQAAGDLVMDAALASIAIEHGAILHTTDRDFARFPGLRFLNPIH